MRADLNCCLIAVRLAISYAELCAKEVPIRTAAFCRSQDSALRAIDRIEFYYDEIVADRTTVGGVAPHARSLRMLREIVMKAKELRAALSGAPPYIERRLGSLQRALDRATASNLTAF